MAGFLWILNRGGEKSKYNLKLNAECQILYKKAGNRKKGILRKNIVKIIGRRFHCNMLRMSTNWDRLCNFSLKLGLKTVQQFVWDKITSQTIIFKNVLMVVPLFNKIYSNYHD